MCEPGAFFESILVSTLLRTMQAERFRITVIVDEYGDTTGLVNVVDLVEDDRRGSGGRREVE